MEFHDQDDTLTGDEALLKEIRDRYTHATEAWRKIREEREIDLRYVAGDPWSEEDRKARQNTEVKRPCISHDELNQYVNQAVNNLRQNKRGIKIDPDGNGADEKTAELKQDLVRTIEYRSNAQSAYITAYQGALEGSYGFFRIGRKYVENEDLTPDNFDHQELTVRNVANSDSILFDPDCKEADWSDAEYCFVLNPISREEFKRRYPNAEIKDFSSDHMQVAKDWLQDRMVLTAEYWKVEIAQRKSYLLDTGSIVDKLPKGATAKNERTVKTRTIMQYVTNGVEILGRTPEPGTILPIVPVIGKEMYVDGERKLMSLVRLAREPQMSLAFLCSQQMEEASLTPKSPYIGYKGQFETDYEAWQTITKIAHAFLQVDPMVDAASGQLLPLPQRVPFTPNFQEYEVAKDSARRAIQAAMGISALPTAAQRNNEKSGVALDKIRSQQDVGSFHFLDNFDRALMLAGRIMDERIPVVYGQTGRQMMLAKADETHRAVTLNTDEPYFDPKTQQAMIYQVDKGSHTITVSAGPSYQSQREAVGNFVDTLVGNLHQLPVAPPQAAKILAIAIQMKELGPKGDQLAEIISPPEQPGQQQMPPQAQQAIAQAQQVIEAYKGELQKLQAEKQGKVVDNEYRLQIEKLKIEADLAKAEVMTKAQSLEERLKFVEDAWSQIHQQGHEAAQQGADQAHEQAMAAQQQQAAQQQATQQQGHEAQQASQAQDAAAQQQQAAAEQQPAQQ